MLTTQDTTPSPKDQVIRAIRHQSPDYVPAWYSFFADETIDKYGDPLKSIMTCFQDDVIFAVLSTFPPMREMVNGWTDEWGCRWARSPEGVGALSFDSPLNNSWDHLEEYLTWDLPGLGKREDLLNRVNSARDMHPQLYLVATTFLGVFERLRALRGSENILLDPYHHPEKLVRLRDALAAEFTDQIFQIGQRGADAVLIADDFGTQDSLLLSPKQWRTFYKPMYNRLFSAIHDNGMDAWFHSCGNISTIVPDLVELGIDVLHPVQPSAMDIRSISEAFRGKVCFAGGIDVQTLLPFATPEEVANEIRHIIDVLDGPDGGFILAPTNSIMPDTPLENIQAMYQTAHEYGHRKRQK